MHKRTVVLYKDGKKVKKVVDVRNHAKDKDNLETKPQTYHKRHKKVRSYEVDDVVSEKEGKRLKKGKSKEKEGEKKASDKKEEKKKPAHKHWWEDADDAEEDGIDVEKLKKKDQEDAKKKEKKEKEKKEKKEDKGKKDENEDDEDEDEDEDQKDDKQDKKGKEKVKEVRAHVFMDTSGSCMYPRRSLFADLLAGHSICRSSLGTTVLAASARTERSKQKWSPSRTRMAKLLVAKSL